jgi:N-acetyl-anhydromuramyl-L-alanine amidase AmpD
MILRWLQRLFGRDERPARPPGGTTSVSSTPPPAKGRETPEPIPSPSVLRPPSSAIGGPAVVPPVRQVERLYPQTHRQTPNLSRGRIITPTHIILHHTGGSYTGSVSWCLDPASKVSYHCIIARSGKRTILAQPTQRTWHAGVSSWQGRKNCNDFSIGVAWEGDTYQTPLSEDAILSAVEYLLPILDKFEIPLKNLIRHADIAPGRKTDCSPAAQKQLLTTLKQILSP